MIMPILVQFVDGRHQVTDDDTRIEHNEFVTIVTINVSALTNKTYNQKHQLIGGAVQTALNEKLFRINHETLNQVLFINQENRDDCRREDQAP